MESSISLERINLSAIKAVGHDGVNLQVLLETDTGFQISVFPAPKQALLGLQQLSQLLTFNQPVDSNEVSRVRQDLNQIEMIPVVSSNIAAIGYSDSSSVLQVDFMNGTRYRYFNVPTQVFTAFLVARSKGRYFNNIIKSDSAFDYLQVK